MDNNTRIGLIIFTITLILASLLSGLIGYNLNDSKQYIDTIDTLYKYDTIRTKPERITDTLTKLKKTSIKETIFVTNPQDSILLNNYKLLSDSLMRLNATVNISMDTVTNQNDTIKVDVDKLRNAITFDLKYSPRIKETKIVTKYIDDKSMNYGTLFTGIGTGILATIIIYSILKR
jgi:hypothetical protein